MGMAMNARLLSIGAFVLVSGIIGLICLFFPGSIQAYAKWSLDRDLLSGGRLVRNFVLSGRYLIVVRAVGIIALVMCGFAIWASTKGH